MRKGAVVLSAAAAAMVLAAAGPAQAEETPPRHGHVLVLGLELDAGQPIGFRKCVDLAAGKALPLGAHHAHSHTGNAGKALAKAGHAVVPTVPYGPFADCAELEEMLG